MSIKIDNDTAFFRLTQIAKVRSYSTLPNECITKGNKKIGKRLDTSLS